MKRYYIAYGSNLNIEQMKWRCPDAKVVGTSQIDGYRLMYKGSQTGAYLTIEKAKGFDVPVAIWEVSENDEGNLDRYEGFPTFYYKKDMELDVTDMNSGKVKRYPCFAYIMHEERRLGIPGQSYINTCVEGYESFGFSKEYLEEAFQYSCEGV